MSTLTIEEILEKFDARFPVPAPPKHAVRDFIRTITHDAEMREKEIKDARDAKTIEIIDNAISDPAERQLAKDMINDLV